MKIIATTTTINNTKINLVDTINNGDLVVWGDLYYRLDTIEDDEIDVECSSINNCDNCPLLSTLHSCTFASYAFSVFPTLKDTHPELFI